MSIEVELAELAKREVQRAEGILRESTRLAMLESDMVTPRKKEGNPYRMAEGLSLRDLTDGEKRRLRNIGMSSANIDRCRIDGRGIFHLDCRNSSLEGTRHPTTGVPFERRRISVNGVMIEGVFPKFQSVVELRLPERLYRATESEQFRYLNAQLRETIDRDSWTRANFSEKEIRMIESGRAPAGFTWHHNESRGVMQLVETATHARTGHTGGDSIWCR